MTHEIFGVLGYFVLNNSAPMGGGVGQLVVNANRLQKRQWTLVQHTKYKL